MIDEYCGLQGADTGADDFRVASPPPFDVAWLSELETASYFGEEGGGEAFFATGTDSPARTARLNHDNDDASISSATAAQDSTSRALEGAGPSEQHGRTAT